MVVSVRANNIDRHGVTFHYSLYHVSTPGQENTVNFDNVVVNCPAVRSFLVKNTTDRTLVLGMWGAEGAARKEVRPCLHDSFSLLTSVRIP